MLQISDENWREHLNSLDHLRQGIHLRGYAQKNPKQEFKREAFELFERLIDTIKLSITEFFLKVEIKENKINSVSEKILHKMIFKLLIINRIKQIQNLLL